MSGFNDNISLFSSSFQTIGFNIYTITVTSNRIPPGVYLALLSQDNGKSANCSSTIFSVYSQNGYSSSATDAVYYNISTNGYNGWTYNTNYTISFSPSSTTTGNLKIVKLGGFV